MKNAIFILAGILAAHLLMAPPADATDRHIQESASLDGIEQVSVDGHVGKILVSADSSEKLQLDLELSPDQGEDPDLDSVRLIMDRSGKTLKLGLDVPFKRDDMNEKWTIRVPSRLALKLNIDVGDLVVDQINGGLELSVDVGKIQATASEGSVRARTDVGDIKVKSSTKSYGNVVLDAGVGDTRLSIDGHRVVYDKSPGPGNRVSLDGPGRDAFDLKAGVGDAELEIE